LESLHASEGNGMPSRKHHLEFDDRLRKNSVICEDTDGNAVHARLDRNSKHFADMHRELDYFHSDVGIRDFIDNIVNSIGTIAKSTATDYVRIAYGHLCLDYMASKLKREYDCSYRELNWRGVYTRTWKYFQRNGYHRTYYRER
jgi:hypothetical protein